MTQSKRILLLFMCAMLALAILACNFPRFNREPDPPIISDETPLSEKSPSGEDLTDETEAIESTETLTPTVTVPDDIGSKQVFLENGVEITLPGSFVLGDPEEDLPSQIEGLPFLGEADPEGGFQINQDDLLLLAYEFDDTGQVQTSMAVIKNDQFGGIPLMVISTFAESMMGDRVQFLDQQQITLNGRNLLRFLISTAELGVQGSQAVYLFNESGKLWIIGFYINSNQVEARLEVFDDAVASFKIVDVD
jgi:hypothetical protein